MKLIIVLFTSLFLSNVALADTSTPNMQPYAATLQQWEQQRQAVFAQYDTAQAELRLATFTQRAKDLQAFEADDPIAAKALHAAQADTLTKEEDRQLAIKFPRYKQYMRQNQRLFMNFINERERLKRERDQALERLDVMLGQKLGSINTGMMVSGKTPPS